jgi:hypothetical protein
VVREEDIAVCIAIAGYITVKLPFLAKNSSEKPVVRATRNSVDSIVTAHDATDLAFLHTGLERRHV